MEKKVAIIQSNYIPWKGYFDIINQVDLFIFHDDLQYTKNDWRNRNKIKTPNGPEWLTIPCGTSEKRLICEVILNENKWQIQHWRKIKSMYAKAPYFKEFESFFENIYLKREWNNLSELNQCLITQISRKFLGIVTEFDDSRKYELTLTKAERVKELLIKSGATVYVSGPSAKNYLRAELLAKEGIELKWMNYNNYPVYDQLYPPFTHEVSIIDLLFNTGPDARKFIMTI